MLLSLGHPQAIGQVDASKTVLDILKKKLIDKKGSWAEELPSVLQEY